MRAELAALVCCLVLTAAAASAEGDGEPSPVETGSQDDGAGELTESETERRAKALFHEGRAAAERGEHGLACEKFAASLALHPRASTLLNLGACHEALGRSATALQFWRLGAAELAADDPRLALAQQTIAALDERAPKLQVTLQGVSGREVVVRLDGAPIDVARLDAPLRLDPGEHRLVLVAKGHEDATLALALEDGDDKTVALVLGRALAPPPPRVTPPADEARAIPVWVWPTGALGLASAGVAVGFAVDYAATVSRQEERCRGALEVCSPDPPGSYDPAGDNAQKERDAILGTVFAVAGGVAIVAAIVGIAVGGDERVSVDAGGLGLRF